jgi:hypothetical protein
MTDLRNIIQKLLINEEFVVGGYRYNFLSVEADKEGIFYSFVINVTQPQKGQSYSVTVFSEHIHDILVNFWKYIGTSFSYSETLLVDGEEPVKSGVYVSPEKEKEVLFAIRDKIRRLSFDTDIGKLSFNIYWKPFQPQFAIADDVYIDFRFFIELSNFELNGNPVKPNLDMADEISAIILELMHDSDSFRNACDDVIYMVIEDEIEITHANDLYFQAMYYASKLDGFHVEPKWNYSNLEPKMFT